MPRTYVALDLELTGLDPEHDEIIEIGMVRFRGDQVLDTFSSLVYTDRRISHKAQQLSGITQEEVSQAPTLQSISGEVLAFVGRYPLIGHSIGIDISFLANQGQALSNLTIDTFEMASIVLPEADIYSLQNLIAFLDIEASPSHRALSDATATRQLFLALVKRFQSWDPVVLEELSQLGERREWGLLQLFHDIAADLQSGGSRTRQRISSLSQPQPFEEGFATPLDPSEEITPVNVDELVETLMPGGALSRVFPHYEHRPQQIDMFRAVSEAFNTPNHLLIEAGTGTGKSLAYLLPAIAFAVTNGRRVVISSNTINLQDQLYTKDLPDLQRISPFSFRAALLKGRSNYICLRRLQAFRRTRSLSRDGIRVLAKVLAWLPKTRTGDRAELLLIDSEWRIWSDLSATSESCLGDQCPFFQSGECFFFRARSRAERAHLLIVNHALLLSDLVLENLILPPYDHVIVDEGHHLEEQATNQFSVRVGRQDVADFLHALGSPRRNSPTGLLSRVPGLFPNLDGDSPAYQRITRLLQQTHKEIGRAQDHLDELFQAIERFLDEHAGDRAASARRYSQHTRLTSGLRIQPAWSEVEVAWDNLAAPLHQILSALEKLLQSIDQQEIGQDEEEDDVLQRLKVTLQMGQEMYRGMEHILLEPDENGIYWISLSRPTNEIAVHSAPLHVGVILSEKLFMEKECVILTSATLRTTDSFDYIRDRLGLEYPAEVALDSPFDFEASTLLYVPKDIPEPNQPYYQKNVEHAVVQLCRATEGRALILFTSNSQLYATYRATRPSLERQGITVYGQGMDGSRRQILRRFRSTPKSVLMGTRSFWEGVDVIGEALSCLVIARLPFSVPTDPIFAARAETFEDPFNQYYLPEAILRFRQGFGRLIRSRNDYGVVVVLDKRLLTKSYGKSFLRSLPPCTARQGPLKTMAPLAERWLEHKKQTDD